MGVQWPALALTTRSGSGMPERGSYRAGLQGHTAPVYSIAFTPDSRRLLSGSEDRTLRVWDVESGYCVSIIQGYAGALYDVAWSPDGQQLASVGSRYAGDALGCGRQRRCPERCMAIVGSWMGVGWSPDGQLLASAGWDNAIRLWNPVTGACTHILRDPDYSTRQFYSVAWSPDGHLLASWELSVWGAGLGDDHPQPLLGRSCASVLCQERGIGARMEPDWPVVGMTGPSVCGKPAMGRCSRRLMSTVLLSRRWPGVPTAPGWPVGVEAEAAGNSFSGIPAMGSVCAPLKGSPMRSLPSSGIRSETSW